MVELPRHHQRPLGQRRRWQSGCLCSQPTNHCPTVGSSLPSCYLCSPFIRICLNSLTPAVSSHEAPLVALSYFCLSLFDSIFCLPSSVFTFLCKTQKCNQHSSFLPILAYTLLPCVQIFIFPEFLPNHISFVFALSSPADSSFFLRLPCLLTRASCHSPCSPSLSLSKSLHSHALLPRSSPPPPPLRFAAGTTVTCRCPLLHTEDVSFSRACCTKNSVHASSLISFFSVP